MGVKIFIFIVVPYVLAAGCVSFCLWDWLSRGEPSVSSTIRNLVLIWGAPLATGLAVWRSMVAQKQAETAQKGWLSDRYQRAVEMLGHDLDFIHVGGIYILRDIALEHPDEYWREVDALLKIYDLGRIASIPEDLRQQVLDKAITDISRDEKRPPLKSADPWWRRLCLWPKTLR